MPSWGSGNCPLAKFLVIAAGEDAPGLDIRDVGAFLQHVWNGPIGGRTCISDLYHDGYPGLQRHGVERRSKVVMAAAGSARRVLATSVPSEVEQTLPPGFLPGCLCAAGRTGPVRADLAGCPNRPHGSRALDLRMGGALPARRRSCLDGFPLAVLVDDAAFASANLGNFLWTAFTRSDPARDLHGTGAFVEDKHWGCRGILILDARVKPHHAPALESDPDVVRRVEARAARGGDLHGLF